MIQQSNGMLGLRIKVQLETKYWVEINRLCGHRKTKAKLTGVRKLFED